MVALIIDILFVIVNIFGFVETITHPADHHPFMYWLTGMSIFIWGTIALYDWRKYRAYVDGRSKNNVPRPPAR